MAIKILVAHPTANGRAFLQRHLQDEDDLELVGSAEDGREAVDLAESLRVEVVVLDSRLASPGALEVAERIMSRFPDIGIILMAPQADPEEMRRAMMIGVADYLVDPVEPEELTASVIGVHERIQSLRRSIMAPDAGAQEAWSSRVVAVYSARGGIGKSLTAANLAVALALEGDAAVALVDLDLEFGNLDLLLNVAPERTIASLLNRMHQLDADLLEGYLTPHPGSAIRMLAAPARPGHADTITATVVERLLQVLKERHRSIIIDTPSNLRDTTLAALEMSDLLVLLAAPELLALHSAQVALEMIKQMHYPEERIRLVLNRADGEGGIAAEDVEETLGMKIAARLPNDPRTANESINEGVPFMLSQPHSPLSQAMRSLGALISDRPSTAGAGNGKPEGAAHRRGWLQALFGAPS